MTVVESASDAPAEAEEEEEEEEEEDGFAGSRISSAETNTKH